MYHFSRCIYRELAPDIIEDHGSDPTHNLNHERVLHACEANVERLATDWMYFKHPTRTLFNDIRAYFPIGAQRRVFDVVDRYMRFAKDYYENRPRADQGECRATTRRGTPCQRTPLPHNGYCPSHQHLAETETTEVGTEVGSTVAA